MDTLQSALNLISQNCFLASIDLKDAYNSVPIFQEHRKYLRLIWRNQLFQFNALPNDLAPGPCWFTKLLKPVFALLRKTGHISTSFLDDSLLVADNKESCMENVSDTVALFRKLGFIVYPHKSVFEPTTKIQYLGAFIDSINMKVELTQERKSSIKTSCLSLLNKLLHQRGGKSNWHDSS